MLKAKKLHVKVGDNVKIIESKPISKLKSWLVLNEDKGIN